MREQLDYTEKDYNYLTMVWLGHQMAFGALSIHESCLTYLPDVDADSGALVADRCALMAELLADRGALMADRGALVEAWCARIIRRYREIS